MGAHLSTIQAKLGIRSPSKKRADGKVVLITGCSEGSIGHAMAVEFSRRGADVYATSRRTETMRGLPELGIQTLALDVRSESSVKSAVDRIIQSSGSIDILINNAGVCQLGPAADLPLEAVRSTLDTNVTGVLAVTQAVFPHMAAQRAGRILNISSASGFCHVPFWGAYAASKAALDALTNCMRMEMAPFGVQVTLISPGFIRTEIISKANTGLDANIRKGSPYDGYQGKVLKGFNQMAANAIDADYFADWVADVALSKRPRWRHVINFPLAPVLEMMPMALRDSLLMPLYGLSRSN